MPKYTNRLNLPQALVDAVTNDDYSRGECDLSITQLIKPMRAVVLEREYSAQITEDVSDRLWSLYGKITHKILESSNIDKNIVAERRLFMEVDGVKISGAMDSYEIEGGSLIDWKFTTSYKFKKGDIPEEWEQQQNCYAELLRHNGHKIDSLEIIGLLRDHSKLEAKRDEYYPQLPVARMPIPLWSQEKTISFIKDRVAVYKDALKTLPQCTAEERWASPDVWAIKKKGAARAINGGLYTDADAASRKLASLGGGHEVEFRPGENKRCDNYCAAAAFCIQYRALRGGK